MYNVIVSHPIPSLSLLYCGNLLFTGEMHLPFQQDIVDYTKTDGMKLQFPMAIDGQHVRLHDTAAMVTEIISASRNKRTTHYVKGYRLILGPFSVINLDSFSAI